MSTFDQRARAAGITFGYWLDGEWPYGPNVNIETREPLVEWAEANNLRWREPRKRCLHWVIAKARRCGALQDVCHDGVLHTGDSFDHPSFWVDRDSGKPALILAQPYVVNHDELDAVRANWPVTIEVTDEAPWYGFHTHGVFVRPLDGVA